MEKNIDMKEIKNTILGCFEMKLPDTDKTVVDNFVDNYEMYINSQHEEDADYWYREADEASGTLLAMCENRTEYNRLLKVINKLL